MKLQRGRAGGHGLMASLSDGRKCPRLRIKKYGACSWRRCAFRCAFTMQQAATVRTTGYWYSRLLATRTRLCVRGVGED